MGGPLYEFTRWAAAGPRRFFGARAGDPVYPGGQVAQAAGAPADLNGGLASEVHTLERAVYEVKRIIVGQDQLVERMLVGLLAKGHVLLEGVPGVAKTLAVETFARVVGGTFARIQFTPDLVPTDIVGTRIYRQGKEEFDIELGPVVVNFLLADEINRAPAKVQSALLEVMQERRISIGGKDFPMPNPFLVMATQNPIEQEGVYALPEAQRDRFLFKINIDYPSPEEEREIIYRMGVRPPEPEADPRSWRPAAAAGRRQQQFRPPRARRLCGPGRHGYPPSRPVRHARRQGVGRLRRIPACVAGHHRRRPGAGTGPRARLRGPAGRHRGHPRRTAPPAGADLRRDRRRDFPGDRDQPNHADRCPAAGERRSTARTFGAPGGARRGGCG